MINDDICRHNFLVRDRSQSFFFPKLSRFLQRQFFFALHFLRFGLTALISVSHRAGYPVKSVKNKDTQTIHIHYWPFWQHCKIKQRRQSLIESTTENDAFQPGNFLVGEHGCEYCHYRFHLVLPG